MSETFFSLSGSFISAEAFVACLFCIYFRVFVLFFTLLCGPVHLEMLFAGTRQVSVQESLMLCFSFSPGVFPVELWFSR